MFVVCTCPIMRTLLILSLTALAVAAPNGLYHQEYNFKTHSSSYKNNELQHKNDDAGFYTEDGDLEGRVKPKVNSHNEHSEYVNPKLKSLGYSDGYGQQDRIATKIGNFADMSLGNQYDSLGSSNGYAAADRLYGGSSGYSSGSRQHSYGSYQSGSSSGLSSGLSNAYGGSQNMEYQTQKIQNELARQLDMAVRNQHRASSRYMTSASDISRSQVDADVRSLEEDLRNNLTRRLQDDLHYNYGEALSMSGGYYGGGSRNRLTQNVGQNQNLAALSQELEKNLLNKLHESISTTYKHTSSHSSSSSSSSSGHGGVGVLIPRPSETYRPNSLDYEQRPQPLNIQDEYYPSRPVKYTPIPNPDSITLIASRVQSEINTNLDSILDKVQQRYNEPDAYLTSSTLDMEIERIRSELLRNMTMRMDNELRRNYGRQIQKGDYYYSVGPSGQSSTDYNYSHKDYDELRRQVETNLVLKLNQTVERLRERYVNRGSSSNYGSSRYVSHQGGSNQIYASNYNDLQRQLQEQLSRQLQSALSQHKHRFSMSGSYQQESQDSPQNYQYSLDELSRELQRNLTEQLERFQSESRGSNSYSINRGGSDYESLRSNLQKQLMAQLQQGLRQQYSYSASASYGGHASYGSHSSYGSQGASGSYGSQGSSGSSGRYRSLGSGRLQQGIMDDLDCDEQQTERVV